MKPSKGAEPSEEHAAFSRLLLWTDDNHNGISDQLLSHP